MTYAEIGRCRGSAVQRQLSIYSAIRRTVAGDLGGRRTMCRFAYIVARFSTRSRTHPTDGTGDRHAGTFGTVSARREREELIRGQHAAHLDACSSWNAVVQERYCR